MLGFDHNFIFCKLCHSNYASIHLAVSRGKNGPQDLSVLLHFLKLPLQSTLDVRVGHHFLQHVLLQRAPESSLVSVLKLEPGGLNKDRGQNVR